MKLKSIALAVSLAVLAGNGVAATEADIENTFTPYKKGMPSFAGLTPGVTINKANVDQFKDILAVGTYKTIKEGWQEIKIGATTSFDLSPAYVEATRKNLGKTKLGAKVGDNIDGYVAGRPFPEEPDAKDPRAGEKLPVAQGLCARGRAGRSQPPDQQAGLLHGQPVAESEWRHRDLRPQG